MSTIVGSIRAEFLRYKNLAESAIEQLRDEELSAIAASADNSVTVICWHISGNLRSRFTDFLTSDGEKPWRNRDEEFVSRTVSRNELLEKWEQGWAVLLRALDELNDSRLAQTVAIRRLPMPVHEALHRALAHTAYHVGQIVYIAKAIRGAEWTYLSIRPGESDKFNANPRP